MTYANADLIVTENSALLVTPEKVKDKRKEEEADPEAHNYEGDEGDEGEEEEETEHQGTGITFKEEIDVLKAKQPEVSPKVSPEIRPAETTDSRKTNKEDPGPKTNSGYFSTIWSKLSNLSPIKFNQQKPKISPIPFPPLDGVEETETPAKTTTIAVTTTTETTVAAKPTTVTTTTETTVAATPTTVTTTTDTTVAAIPATVTTTTDTTVAAIPATVTTTTDTTVVATPATDTITTETTVAATPATATTTTDTTTTSTATTGAADTKNTDEGNSEPPPSIPANDSILASLSPSFFAKVGLGSIMGAALGGYQVYALLALAGASYYMKQASNTTNNSATDNALLNSDTRRSEIETANTTTILKPNSEATTMLASNTSVPNTIIIHTTAATTAPTTTTTVHATTTTSTTSPAIAAPTVPDLTEQNAAYSVLMSEVHELKEEIERKSKLSKNYEHINTYTKTLYIQMELIGRQFFNDPSLEHLEEFKTQINEHMRLAEIEFKDHRGTWDTLHPILKAIIGILATIIFPIAIIVARSERGYAGAFFKPSKEVLTQSAKDFRPIVIGVQDLEDKIEQVLRGPT